MESLYQILKEDVNKFIDKISPIIEKDNELRKLCLGWRILFSNLIEKPTILFIGINPGAGMSGDFNSKFLDDELQLEYINIESNNYQLAKETIALFELMGHSDILKSSSMKTNYNFLITTNLNRLDRFLNRLYYVDLQLHKEFLSKTIEWTEDMFQKMIQPKIIICEGKRVYEDINRNNFVGEEDKNWVWTRPWVEGCGYWERKKDGLILFGYERSYSYIKNKKNVAQVLKPLIDRVL
jgi:hypothetical protein